MTAEMPQVTQEKLSYRVQYKGKTVTKMTVAVSKNIFETTVTWMTENLLSAKIL